MKVTVRRSAVTMAVVVAVAASVGAQAPTPPPGSPTQARYNIAILEAVFETAVQRGAQMLREEVQSVMPADMLLLTGAPRARGVRLEGYGVFFDVDVPAISQTVAWTVTKLNQNDAASTTMMQQLRALLQSMSDRRQREDLDRFLQRVSMQMGIPDTPSPSMATPGGMPQPGAVVTSEASGQSAAARPTFLDDPIGAYESAVKKALIDAMLDYSGPLDIGADEWLTVAARDNGDRLSPASPYEVATILMRIRGSDLLAFRAGRLTREEAHKRVEIREF